MTNSTSNDQAARHSSQTFPLALTEGLEADQCSL